MKRRVPLISRIKLKNFKSLTDVDLPLRGLTILVGENSAGKSSVLQAVNLMGQIVEGEQDPRLVSLNSNEIALGNFDDVLSSAAAEPRMTIELQLHDRSAASSDLQDGNYAPLSTWTLDLEGTDTENGIGRIVRTEVRHWVDDDGEVDHGMIAAWPRVVDEDADAVWLSSQRLQSLDRSALMRLNSGATSPVAPVFTGEGVDSESVDGEDVEFDIAFVDVVGGLPQRIFTTLDDRFEIPQWWLDLLFSGTETLHFASIGGRFREALARFNYGAPSRSEDEGFESWVADRAGADSLGTPYDTWNGTQVAEALKERYLADIKAVLDGTYVPMQKGDKLDVDPGLVIRARTLYVDVVNALARIHGEHFGRIAAVREAMFSPLDTSRFIHSSLRGAIHSLGPLRVAPGVLYRNGKAGKIATLGASGEFTAAALNDRAAEIVDCPIIEGGTQEMTLPFAVSYWLDRFGVASAAVAGDLGRAGISVSITDIGDGRSRDLADVGVGVSQLLPVIVICLLAKETDLILLEQPELHLHPAPQQVLADFLIALARSGRQLIVETHSEYLVNRLRRRVAEDESGEVAEMVDIYYGTREGGSTSFLSLELDEYGGLGSWPKGFFDQSGNDAEATMRASVARRRTRR